MFLLALVFKLANEVADPQLGDAVYLGHYFFKTVRQNRATAILGG